MAKPTNLGLWATTGTKVEPSTGIKAAGWSPGQKPPAQWFNWWMNAIYLWMVWLDAFEATAHTWTATQTFDDIDVQDLTAVTLDVSSFVTFGSTLVVLGATSISATLGVGGDANVGGDLTVTGDASCDNLTVATRATTTNATVNGVIDMAGANPAVGTALLNQLTPASVKKAYVKITLNGTAAPTVDGGINIASVTANAVALLITFAQPMADAHYVPTVTMGDQGSGNLNSPYVGPQLTTAFNVGIYKITVAGALSAGSLDPTAAGNSGLKIFVSVDGKQ